VSFAILFLVWVFGRNEEHQEQPDRRQHKQQQERPADTERKVNDPS
jgi:hypothetical protein